MSHKSNIPKEIRFREANRCSARKRREKELSLIMEKLGKEKTCTTCGFVGDISLFRESTINFEKPNKRMLFGTCKKCRRNKINTHHQNNPEVRKESTKRYITKRDSDPEKKIKKQEQTKKWADKPEVKSRRSKQELERRKKNNTYRWRKLLFNTYKQRGIIKPNQHTIDLLGYTSEELHLHLGDKPTKTAQIDHLIPVSWFIDETDVSLVCSFENLEWKTQNLNSSKQNRYADEVSFDYFNKVKNYIKKEYIDRMIVNEGKVLDILKVNYLLRDY